MERDMENRDWINDFEALKQVNPDYPFTVPAGYFDSLADRILSYKNLNDLKDRDVTGGFTVPPNYFNELTVNIQSRINIENALNTEDAGFTVPAGYFDQLAANIQSRINVEEALNTEDAGFTLPNGYFDNLTQQIQSRIFIEEALSEQPEALAVPEGYFEKLNKNILDKTVNQGTKREKGIVRRLFATTAFKYATAACFAMAIGGGILINELTNPVNEHQNSFLHKQLSAVPVDDIKAYLQLNVDAGDTQQTVTTDDVAVDDNSLKNALQSDSDSLQ